MLGPFGLSFLPFFLVSHWQPPPHSFPPALRPSLLPAWPGAAGGTATLLPPPHPDPPRTSQPIRLQDPEIEEEK